MNLDKAIERITRRLGSVEEDNNNNSKNKEVEKEKEEAEDRARYQEMKLRYEVHPEEESDGYHNGRYLPNNIGTGGYAKYTGKRCNAADCVLECPFWPEDGYLTEDGNVYYEDPNLDEEFYGTDNAIKTRKKIAAMTAEEYEKYKREVYSLHYSQ